MHLRLEGSAREQSLGKGFRCPESSKFARSTCIRMPSEPCKGAALSDASGLTKSMRLRHKNSQLLGQKHILVAKYLGSQCTHTITWPRFINVANPV